MSSQNLRVRGKTAVGRPGFTMIETLVVVAIIGILALTSLPSIQNTLETRRLENAARDIVTTLQQAKYQAVRSRIDHRVNFQQEGTQWYYVIEQQEVDGTWSIMPGSLRRYIPLKFVTSIKSGDSDKTIAYSPLGYQTNFTAGTNTILLQSLKLLSYGQPDEREISFYFGGAIKYQIKSSSGG